METTIPQIVAYWSLHKDECGLSVDWAQAHVLCWRCAYRRNLQRCHIVPRALGGGDESSNTVLLCAQCHAEAPNVADPEFMWVWLRAHAVSFYGTYWQDKGWREYEFIYGRLPFQQVENLQMLIPQFQGILRRCMKQVSNHWGQGKPNAATVAWLLRQVEGEFSGSTLRSKLVKSQEPCMSSFADELTRQARSLPPEERVRLAEELLSSVQDSNEAVEASWQDEIKRRLDEVEHGTAKLVSADEVFAEIRGLLK